MGEIMYIIFGTFIALLFIMALFLLNGKGSFLIAGYNTKSKEAKENYDKRALCRFVGWLLIFISISISLTPISLYFGITWLATCGVVMILVSTLGAVIYANTGNRFRINANIDVPTNTKFTIPAIFILVIVFIGIGALIRQGGKDPVIKVDDNGIQIKSMYGVSVDYADISDISLIDKRMSDIGINGTQRQNGYGGIGDALKGHFKSDSLGEALLFVRVKSSPTIRIERNNKKDIYINFRNSDKTEQIYNEMLAGLY